MTPACQLLCHIWSRQVWEVPWERSFSWNAGDRWPDVTWHLNVPWQEVPFSVFRELLVPAFMIVRRGMITLGTVIAHYAYPKTKAQKLLGAGLIRNVTLKIKEMRHFYQLIYCRQFKYSFVILQHCPRSSRQSTCRWHIVRKAAHSRIPIFLRFLTDSHS